MTNYPYQPRPQPHGNSLYSPGSPGGGQQPGGPQGLSLASMIIGLSSLLFIDWLMLPQLAGVILGHMGLRRESSQGHSFAVTGLITNHP